jgi:hypothetical protein
MTDWIKCSERLPEIDEFGFSEPILASDGADVDRAVFHESLGDSTLRCSSHNRYAWDVTHWMPLPAPPEVQ